ncbi:MAG TPA: S41 family peptidase, partial [Terriglobales bacterium]|nr:S41 family peptidase [Terriglobales bacterium]
IFARVIQLHHLGTIVGDRSAGAVMEAQDYSFTYGTNPITPYGISVTAADLVMEDGQSLENRGVTPDVETVPTAADLAAGRDPVLALAVKLAGGTLDPAAAGKLFPYRWPPFRLQH